ncbi:GNAT family N-acetyltransferase [Benzoatithermus flavus]|uniref:L-ornithine N(alpha)-acyltransferase n=1 Tax=Benzoatithermus flavus TaxID=3108223 RepID=A0ABU8Y031_9PROT
MTIMARANQLQLRLVRKGPEVAAAQRLRYRVFYEEMGAVAPPAVRASRSDEDRFDALADHLVVVDLDRSTRQRPHVVGCYRLLREGAGRERGLFYTATEFDLSEVKAPKGVMMELGRSCVAPEYRNGTVMQLLWRGIADYIDVHGVGLMLGCASLPGTDPEALAPALAYLHHYCLAPEGLRPRALPDRHVDADRLPPEAIDPCAVMRTLPPLLKAYLRMGGMIGEGAVVDHAFNTIDVCLVLPAAGIVDRYQRRCRQRRPGMAEAA